MLLALDLGMSSAIFKTFGPGGALGARWGYGVWEAFSLGGDGFIWFGVAPLLAYLYAGVGSEGNKVLSSFEVTQLGCSLAVDLAVIALLKTLFQRARPPHHKTDFRFVGVDKHSFPSGHATRCWAILGTLFYLASSDTREASNGVGQEVVRIARLHETALLGWGVAMCFGRVALGRHYVTDVIAGALVGRYLVAPLSVALHSYLRL
eukprot:Tamp_32368.p1 GENE.Tamp_32368~~Tamp_32368.p1  ORF type:complete len:206 (+),score=22.48 Tamp_32368:3-620(+)